MRKAPPSDPFSRRPARTDECPRCHGHGTVDVPYALHPESDPVEGAPPDALLAFVVGTFGIFEVCREAAALAVAESRPVAFEFNGQCVVLRPGDEPDRVARRWWAAAYGETPEETWARR